MGGPSIPVGFPSFVFPFNASKTNCGGGFADVLKIGTGCFRCEVGSHRAWVCVEPFLHVDLELVLGMLILEDVGYLSCAPVICGSGSVDWLRRTTWNAERVPE